MKAEPEIDFAKRTKRICCWTDWVWGGRQGEELMLPAFLSLKLVGSLRLARPAEDLGSAVGALSHPHEDHPGAFHPYDTSRTPSHPMGG